MKLFVILWLALVTGLFAQSKPGGLTFSKSSQEVHADPAAAHVVAEYPFKNENGHAVKIAKLDGGCSCISATTGDGKMEIPAGASGVVRVTFEIGKFDGTVGKAVGVFLSTDSEFAPSQHLIMNIVIPVLVSIEPKTVKWKSGSEPVPQKIRIRMSESQPLKITAVTTTSKAFSHTLTTIKEGAEYELTITPLSTAGESAQIGLFRIETDSTLPRYQAAQVFAVVFTPGKQ